MPLEKLTRAQFDKMMSRPTRGPNPEYVRFFRKAQPGQLGIASVEKEGASNQWIRNRLRLAAAEAGVAVKFHRAPSQEQVIFEVTPK